jgi:hypothetical protein
VDVSTEQEFRLVIDADGYGTAVEKFAVDAVLWAADPPSVNDRWVSIERTPEGVIANSWNGLRVILDPETGRALSSSFTK